MKTDKVNPAVDFRVCSEKRAKFEKKPQARKLTAGSTVAARASFWLSVIM
jgi:hypothetical protein